MQQRSKLATVKNLQHRQPLYSQINNAKKSCLLVQPVPDPLVLMKRWLNNYCIMLWFVAILATASLVLLCQVINLPTFLSSFRAPDLCVDVHSCQRQDFHTAFPPRHTGLLTTFVSFQIWFKNHHAKYKQKNMQKIQEGLPESSGSSKAAPGSTYSRGHLFVLASANIESMSLGSSTVGSIPQVNPSWIFHIWVIDQCVMQLSLTSPILLFPSRCGSGTRGQDTLRSIPKIIQNARELRRSQMSVHQNKCSCPHQCPCYCLLNILFCWILLITYMCN